MRIIIYWGSRALGTDWDHNFSLPLTTCVWSPHPLDLKQDFYEMNKLYDYEETLTCKEIEVMWHFWVRTNWIKGLGDQKRVQVDWNGAGDEYKSLLNNVFGFGINREWMNARQTVTILMRTQKTHEKFELKGSYKKLADMPRTFW